MSDELYLSGDGGITAHAVPMTQVVLKGTDGRDLLVIHLDTGTVTGELEDTSEAAAAFVRYLRLELGRR